MVSAAASVGASAAQRCPPDTRTQSGKVSKTLFLVPVSRKRQICRDNSYLYLYILPFLLTALEETAVRVIGKFAFLLSTLTIAERERLYLKQIVINEAATDSLPIALYFSYPS